MKNYFLIGAMGVFIVNISHAEAQKTEFAVTVTEKGFEPKNIDVKAGSHVILNVTRKTDSTCATEIQVPSQKIGKTPLPLHQVVALDIGVVKKGKIRFGCGMDMMDSAQLTVR